MARTIKLRRQTWVTALAFGTVAGSDMGCAGPLELDSVEVGSKRENLASAFGDFPWGGDRDSRYTYPWASPGNVDVCFLGARFGDDDTDDPDPTRMAEVASAVDDSWGRATGLTFNYRGKCPQPVPTTWVSVFLSEVENGGVAHSGVGSRLPADPEWDNRDDIQTRIGDWPGNFRRMVAHEFGHVLGFYHEMERAEADGTDCDYTGDGPGNEYGHVTPYDRQSIMTYCETTRTEEDLLSPLDKLGAEMMYPKQRTGHALACADACFVLAGGAVVRADGAVTIDWVLRGGDVDPHWQVGSSTLQPPSGRLAASDLPDVQNVVQMTFPDAYSNPNSGLYIEPAQQHTPLTGGGTVVKSDALHAAILLSGTATLL
jgi:hypothetical protein